VEGRSGSTDDVIADVVVEDDEGENEEKEKGVSRARRRSAA
jgi:riboflavin synthase